MAPKGSRLKDISHGSSPEPSSSLILRDPTPLRITIICSTVAAVVPFLPHENQIPTIFVKNPSIFYATMVSIMFAFSGSFTALFLENSPRLAKFCRFYSRLSMASAISLLIWFACLQIFARASVSSVR